MNQDLSKMSGEELQGAIQNIMADPAFSQLLGQLQGKTPDAAEKPAVPAITPEMMQKLPQMMSALAPLVSGGGKSEKADGAGDKEQGEVTQPGRFHLCYKGDDDQCAGCDEITQKTQREGGEDLQCQTGKDIGQRPEYDGNGGIGMKTVFPLHNDPS